MIAPGSNRSILVLGMGVSGIAAARLALAMGHQVTVLDEKSGDVLEARARELTAQGAVVQLNVREIPEDDFDLAVVSPGLNEQSKMIQNTLARNILIISELEWAAGHTEKPLLAITGSNGKSTLVKLCSDSLTCAGLSAVPCGNYGMPLSEAVMTNPNADWYVVECSSFQLERIVAFRPHVAVLLNVNPNHLDRHGSMEHYTSLKYRLFQNMASGDVRILNDELEKRPIDAAFRTFSVGSGGDYRFVPDEHRVCRPDGPAVPFLGTLFDNQVMGLTAAAAVAALDACGGHGDVVSEAAGKFEALPHRLNTLCSINGVRFVDDSKATNMAALKAALMAFPGRIRLIAGGRLKETDLNSVKEVLAKKVLAVYLIGESMVTLSHAWGDTVPCRQCTTLEEAVRTAWLDVEPGDSIILSPACASFDQFVSYEDRGRAFARIVEGLQKET
jgi:UDP-N-acetylmuramoylalanine--D-glutamate ligase